ncbi:glyoxalase [Halobacteriales archaeon QS_5_68_33]|nr:MAG: glyoxalase [Halobacteriales archaeon QS_5_68_33]
MADDAGGDPDAPPEDDRADQTTEHAVADHSSDHDHADPAHAGALHHVELCASDLDSTIAFWDWLLGELGYEPKDEWAGGRSWARGPTYVVVTRGDAGPPVERSAPGLDHLAFHAASRSQVDDLTAAIRERDDSTLLYEDRHPYAGGYYALYCEDPEGITVEVVAPAEKRN